MKKFVLKCIFFILIITTFFAVSILLPFQQPELKYYFFAKIFKDSLLENVKSPRIIFIGGSNIGYGINSQLIKDSLHFNPINTGINSEFGLVYMLNNTLKYIKKNDIVVIIPEYDHFFGDFANGRGYLLALFMDGSPKNFLSLTYKQRKNMYPYFVYYCISKWNFINNTNPKKLVLFGKSAYNQYGDFYAHWSLSKEKFDPYPYISEKFNKSIILDLINFNLQIQKIGATLFISYPSYQKSSFDLSKEPIRQVEEALKKTKIPLLGTPERYEFDDSLMFNTSYHLLKKGLDIRTQLLIEDLKKYNVKSN